jgi:putative ABC transport system permease protein
VQKNLATAFLSDGWTLCAIAALGFLVSLIAGGYPSLYLSRFHPTEALKNTLHLGNKSFFGQSLVIVQYALSIFLIISAIFMFKQTYFLKNKNLLALGEQILVIPLYGQNRAKIMETFQNELSQHKNVLEISGTSNLLGQGLARYTSTYRGEKVSFGVFTVCENYLDFMGIESISGRHFSETRNPDGILVNETWLNTLGLEAAETMKGVFKDRPIIGVVKDFHYQSLHRPIEPAMFSMTKKPSYLLIKIRPDEISETIALVKDKWTQIVPNVPFDFAFLDDHIDRLYRSETRWSKIIGYASIFAIFIASLGAFGLTALAVARRTKEIGIRKVLGASIANISLLLSKAFVKRVIFAILIAWPATYYAMNQWLQNFAYRIDLGIDTFLVGSIVAFLIALTSVAYLSIKAANANPIDALHYE